MRRETDPSQCSQQSLSEVPDTLRATNPDYAAPYSGYVQPDEQEQIQRGRQELPSIYRDFKEGRITMEELLNGGKNN